MSVQEKFIWKENTIEEGTNVGLLKKWLVKGHTSTTKEKRQFQLSIQLNLSHNMNLLEWVCPQLALVFPIRLVFPIIPLN